MIATTSFQTPPRILIPKLVKSRDAWKAKATARKVQRKALEIRVRDLEASRERHRERADQLQQQVDHLEHQLGVARAAAVPPPEVSSKKNWTGPAADTIPPTSSTSP